MSVLATDQAGDDLLRFREARLKAKEFGDGVVGAGSAELDYAPASVISRRLRGAIDRGDLGYALPRDLFDLSEATASWYERAMAWRPKLESLAVAPDITSAFAFVLMSMARSDGPVLVPRPGYTKLRRVASELGFEVLEYAVRRTRDGHAYALDEIEEHLRARRRGVLVLIHPHNPTGHLAKKAELEALGRIVERHGALVFSDEVHAPLWLEDEPHMPYASSSGAARQHTVMALSSSKAWGLSGVRVTQLVLPDGALGTRAREGSLLSLLEGSVSSLGVQASIVAYEYGNPWLAALRARLRDNRDRLTAFAAESPVISDYVPPGSSFLAWMSLAMDLSSETAAQLLQRRARLGVLGAEEFGSSSTTWFRLNFGSTPEKVEQYMSLIAHMATSDNDARRTPLSQSHPDHH